MPAMALFKTNSIIEADNNISQSKESVYLVEVKYRSKFDRESMKNLADEQDKRWYPYY